MGQEKLHVLKNVSFTVQKGDLLALTGPSGSGKSTLMNILGCLDSIDNGDYLLDGTSVLKRNANQLADIRSKNIGFVFQNFSLLSRMSALENVELPLLYSETKNSKKKAMEALDIVGLSDRMKHEPNQLSGGQRQRVAIARAIVNDPALILADEPTGNLDSKTGLEIIDLFHRLNKEGRTIIVVTHEQDVANECHRQLHMLDGVLQKEFFKKRKKPQISTDKTCEVK